MTTFSSVTVSAVQMISSPSVSENLVTAERLIAHAAQAGAKLVLLPEYFAIFGTRDTDKLLVSEVYGTGPIQSFLSATAARYGVWLAGGTIPIKCEDPSRVRNSLLVFDPHGRNVARYDKMHLFGFENGSECYREASTIEAGDTPVIMDTQLGRIGLAVCYDMRFPELFRTMGKIDILLLPAAFTATTGRAHWEVLLRARAIENQCFVIASGQGGLHSSERETFGHSMVVDPWGRVLDCLPQGEGVVTAVLKRSRIERVRKALPALEHRVLP